MVAAMEPAAYVWWLLVVKGINVFGHMLLLEPCLGILVWVKLLAIIRP